MKTWSVLACLILAMSFVSAEEPKEAGKGGRMGGFLSPEMLDKTLTGELAINEEQKGKIAAAYEKTVKPIADKMTAAADREARRAIMPEMRTATETFRAEIKPVLNEKQNTKVDEVLAEAAKAREARKKKE
jgi:hypothetical protein